MQTKLYKKPTDHYNYLHAESAHPLLLKKCIPYNQALRIKCVRLTYMNTKSIQMTWSNDLWKKGTKKHHSKPNPKSGQSREIIKQL